jgi:hypothetical protein
MPTVVVAGSIAQRPRRPGHAWAFLGYLLGFRAIGYDVLFLDRLEDGGDPRWLEEAMARVGLGGCYAALGAGSESVGMSRRQVLEQLRHSLLLLNVNGFLVDPELLAAAPRRVYLDIDPGFAQLWAEQGLADTFAGHDDFVTVGTNIGGDGCTVPMLDRDWIPTLPPVALECWPFAGGGRGFTSIGSWRGPFGPIEHRGVLLGLRAHEFRRFLDLPSQVDASFEIALDIDVTDTADLAALARSEWGVADPLTKLGDFDSYAAYIRGSLAEVSIAKQLYVATRGGWFSDRSATYLASGKPVIAQDTGFGGALPTGEGLLSFDDPGGAAAAAEAVLARPLEHARAAREIAEDHLDSRRVLGRLLDRLGAR